MNADGNRQSIGVWLGVLWAVVVAVSYLWSNTAYYGEKIGVFSRFILQTLGGG